MMTYLPWALCLTSFGLNAYLLLKIGSMKSKRVVTYDAQMLMKDLVSGGAVMEIKRLDPGSLLMRSPR